MNCRALRCIKKERFFFYFSSFSNVGKHPHYSRDGEPPARWPHVFYQGAGRLWNNLCTQVSAGTEPGSSHWLLFTVPSQWELWEVAWAWPLLPTAPTGWELNHLHRKLQVAMPMDAQVNKQSGGLPGANLDKLHATHGLEVLPPLQNNYVQFTQTKQF